MGKTVEQAKAALSAAQADYQDELHRDCERSEGSGAQERRREERLQELRDAVDRCEKDLAAAEKGALNKT